MSDGLNYKLLLADAYKLAAMSPDPSTQIGSFIINSGQQEWLTRAFNRPTNGFEMTDADWETKARKYLVVEHSERNTIYFASLYGICTAGATMVATWAACADCARAIVQSGIKKLVRHKRPDDGATARWMESISIGDKIMRAGGVEIQEILGPIPNAPKVLRDGLWIDPSYVDNWHNHVND